MTSSGSIFAFSVTPTLHTFPVSKELQRAQFDLTYNMVLLWAVAQRAGLASCLYLVVMSIG